MYFPLIGLDGKEYFDIRSYVERNRRFIEKMAESVAFITGDFRGLDGNFYNSVILMQSADEEFYYNLNAGLMSINR